MIVSKTLVAAALMLAGWAAPAFAAPVDLDPFGCAGPAGDPAEGTPEWQARDRANVACAVQRAADLALHPQSVAGFPGDGYRDPARHDGRRFRFLATTVTDRQGGELEVEVYRPCAAGTCAGMPAGLRTFEPPYPGVLVLHGGYRARKELHRWALQSLAEAGYMTVSLNAIHDRDEFFEDSSDVLRWFTGTPERPAPDGEFNPFWNELDADRLGVAGHSGGGATAARHGHGDPRFRAVVGWDRSGRYDLPEQLRVPSLSMVADHGFTPGPRSSSPPPSGYQEGTVDRGDKHQDYDRLRAAGLDTMKIALRAATHLDWVPNASAASRYGEAVSTYYTLAWFDRYLKGPEDPALAADAFRRLTAQAFEGSADRHNISQGLFDPVAGNVPYRLEGRPVSDRLSFYFASKCFLQAPSSNARWTSDDLRRTPCSRQTATRSAAAGTCRSRRRPARVRRGRKVLVDLSGRRRARVRVTIRAVSERGRRVTVRRTFRTCVRRTGS